MKRRIKQQDKASAPDCQVSEAGCDIPDSNTAADVTPPAASFEGEKSAKDAPADPTGAAPATSPEQLAPAAPSPSTPAESPAAGTCADLCAGISEMARHFAGVDPREWPAPGWATAEVGRIEPSEVDVLGYLEAMGDDARERVLTYACSSWPVAREVVVHVDCAPSAEAMAEAVLGLVKGAGQ